MVNVDQQVQSLKVWRKGSASNHLPLLLCFSCRSTLLLFTVHDTRCCTQVRFVYCPSWHPDATTPLSAYITNTYTCIVICLSWYSTYRTVESTNLLEAGHRIEIGIGWWGVIMWRLVIPQVNMFIQSFKQLPIVCFSADIQRQDWLILLKHKSAFSIPTGPDRRPSWTTNRLLTVLQWTQRQYGGRYCLTLQYTSAPNYELQWNDRPTLAFGLRLVCSSYLTSLLWISLL